MTSLVADLVLEPATGKALPVRRGQRLSLEQVGDGQCVDLNVCNLCDRRERFDAARTRMIHGVRPSVGAMLWSNPPANRPLLSIVADTVGQNDLLFPACTRFEYEALAGCADHTNCHDILAEAGREYGLRPEDVHDPLNVWLDAGVANDGSLVSRAVSARRGDRIDFLALIDVLVVVSVCGDDLFGSSQFEVKPVRVTVSDVPGGDPGPDAGRRAPGRELTADPCFVPSWRTAAVRPRDVELDLPDELAPTIEALVRSGRFGRTPGDVVRAVLFHWWQETVVGAWPHCADDVPYHQHELA